MEDNLHKLVLKLFEIEVVKFGNFKLKSGVMSPVYFDLRVIISYPKLMDLVANLLTELIQTSVVEKFEHVCGVPYTALPMATLVSSKSGIPMLIRRREAKDHGTKKIIEGSFTNGDSCIIIEDVISSGSSILETVKDLENSGLKVSHAIVVLDREQGGAKNLEAKGLNVHVLLTINKVLKILFDHKKITQDVVQETQQYISRVSLSYKDGVLQPNNGLSSNKRLKMTFLDRAQVTTNKTARKIFEIIEAKKSLLCVAADVTDAKQLIKLAAQLGPHICIFKTHFDMVEDFNKDFSLELIKLAKNFNFLIMEDRKFSDIGNTISLQYRKIKPWADLVTSHSIAGENTIKGLSSVVEAGEEKGCFLVAEFSCQGNLISKDYTSETLKMAENNTDFVVGLVCQSPEIVKVPHLIQLTPGVKIEEGNDSLGQKYNDPEFAVLEKGADVAVVGRGIIGASNPEKAAIIYKEKLWSAYLKRISKS
ncbi:hypothetical protein RUM43_004793 [Polyplax serrata]|uniref:Uridine 5'-monophosphate synthase n=1 Tax=Polyplax serrata TaxID=468196 RepID=A0AAN8SB83_POLSC